MHLFPLVSDGGGAHVLDDDKVLVDLVKLRVHEQEGLVEGKLRTLESSIWKSSVVF